MRHLLRRRQLHSNAKLLRRPRRPRARCPRRIVVLGLAKPVVTHLSQPPEQLADIRREAAERLEEQCVDRAAVLDSACIILATPFLLFSRVSNGRLKRS